MLFGQAKRKKGATLSVQGDVLSLPDTGESKRELRRRNKANALMKLLAVGLFGYAAGVVSCYPSTTVPWVGVMWFALTTTILVTTADTSVNTRTRSELLENKQ